MKTALRLAMLMMIFAAVVSATACKKRYDGPGIPDPNMKAFEKTRLAVNFLDPKLDDRVESDITQPERFDDGRLKVAVNLRNRTGRPLTLQARTVYKDAKGLSSGDEIAWDTIFLDARQSQTFSSVSETRDAVSATVEVRLLRRK